MDSDNPYDILGLTPAATAKEIRKAFKQKALLCHPDKQQETDSGEAFRRLRAAYEILRDDAARVQYNRDWEAKREFESRYKDLSDTRKRFREDLLAREAAYRAQKAAQTDTNLHRKRHAKSRSPSPEVTKKKPETMGDLGNVVYLQWTARTTLYTESILRGLFAQSGGVMEVVLDRGRNGAYIIFTSADAASAAGRLGLTEFQIRPATRKEAEDLKRSEAAPTQTEDVKAHLKRLREKLKKVKSPQEEAG